jgi:hypothetical protein
MKLYNRIKETTNTSGTGPVSLLGAVQSYSRFDEFYQDDDNLFYCITSIDSYEVGKGVYNNNTLIRLEVLSSSNSNQLVDFDASTKQVYVTYPGEFAALQSDNNTNNKIAYFNDGFLSSSDIDFIPSGFSIIKDSESKIEFKWEDNTFFILPSKEGNGVISAISIGKNFTFNNIELHGNVKIGDDTGENVVALGIGGGSISYQIPSTYGINCIVSNLPFFSSNVSSPIYTFNNAGSFSDDISLRVSPGGTLILSNRGDISELRNFRCGRMTADEVVINLDNIPTEDPGIIGRLYRDEDDYLKISLGVQEVPEFPID